MRGAGRSSAANRLAVPAESTLWISGAVPLRRFRPRKGRPAPPRPPTNTRWRLLPRWASVSPRVGVAVTTKESLAGAARSSTAEPEKDTAPPNADPAPRDTLPSCRIGGPGLGALCPDVGVWSRIAGLALLTVIATNAVIVAAAVTELALDLEVQVQVRE